MATRRDLVEAYSFNRRLLLIALVSGAAAAREADTPRPGRILVGCLALAVLLLAGAGVARTLSPSHPGDWPSGDARSVAPAQVTGPGR